MKYIVDNMDFVQMKEVAYMKVIHIPANIRKKIGIPEGTKFKIWRDGNKIKLESV